MSELKITKDDIGKQFRRRDGEIVAMTQWDDYGVILPVFAGVSWYTANGHFWSENGPSPEDLVERLDDDAAATPASVPMASDAEFRNGVAVQTLQTLIKVRPNQSVEYYAETAYQIADAMLAERAKGVE